MILRNIDVQGFGCFADEIRVGPFSDGINLLYAPNGTGKSTLIKAFTSALVDGYRVKCAELQDWKPWGRGLTPRIVVEFDHRDKAYRLEKKFLQGAGSLLLRKEGLAWKQFMQNDDADDFIRNDILNCTPAGSGLSKPKNWGLAQILWTTQGDLAMPELAGNVVESIQRSVGATLTAAGSKIESKLASLYAEFYQPKRAALKKTAPLNTLQEECGRLSLERADAEQELAKFDRKLMDLDELRSQVDAAKALQVTLEEQRLLAAGLVERYRTLLADRKQLAERKTGRQAIYQKLKQDSDVLGNLREKIKETEAFELECASSLPTRKEQVEACTKAWYRIQDEVGSSSRERQQANTKLLTAQLSREYLETLAQLETVSAAIGEITRIELQIQALAKKKIAVTAPSVPELATARKLISEEQQYLLQLRMSRVIAEIEPSRDALVRVTEGETVGEVALRQGTMAAIPGSPNLTFEVPGFGFIHVRGPETDYASVRDSLEKCRTALSGFEKRFGTRDADRLELLRAEYTLLEQQIETLQAQRTGILGKNPANQLELRRTRASQRLEEIEQHQAGWRQCRPDPALLQTSAREALGIAEIRFKNADERCQALQAALVTAEKELSQAEQKLTGFHQTLANLLLELKALTNDGRLDADRNASLNEALLEYDAARAALERIEADLREFGNDPAPRLVSIEKELTLSMDHLKRLENGILQGETEIGWLTSKSPYDRFANLDEAATIAIAAVTRERRRMDAIKLLNNVVVATKADLLKSVAMPVEKAANENLAAICQNSFGEIRMSSIFGTVGVRPPSLEPEDDAVQIAQLSGGEKEQLHLCTRLALACELAKHERQLLVLDDVLTFTDNDRLARICDLLEKAAGKLQILILTCHPERFISVANSKPFDLAAMTKRHAAATR